MSQSHEESRIMTETAGCRSVQRLAPVISLASPIIFTALIREAAEMSTIVYVGRTGGADFIGAATLGNMMVCIRQYLTTITITI